MTKIWFADTASGKCVLASNETAGIRLKSVTSNGESRPATHAGPSWSDVVAIEQARVIRVVRTPIAPDVSNPEAKAGGLQQFSIQDRHSEN